MPGVTAQSRKAAVDKAAVPSTPRLAGQVNVARLFETFVTGLTTRIREKVSEAVSKATAELLSGRLSGAVVTRRRRRRAAAKPPTSPKPVRLSKYGKRIGRPPKVRDE